jgi:hypothetical protein
LDLAKTVYRSPEAVYHTAEQSLADADGERPLETNDNRIP